MTNRPPIAFLPGSTPGLLQPGSPVWFTHSDPQHPANGEAGFALSVTGENAIVAWHHEKPDSVGLSKETPLKNLVLDLTRWTGRCHALGWLLGIDPDGNVDSPTRTCKACRGAGAACETCGGSGRVEVPYTAELANTAEAIRVAVLTSSGLGGY